MQWASVYTVFNVHTLISTATRKVNSLTTQANPLVMPLLCLIFLILLGWKISMIVRSPVMISTSQKVCLKACIQDRKPVRGAYFAIMHFAIRSKLSYATIDHLLDLLRLLCPDPSQLPMSFYKFKKFLQLFRFSYDKEKYCFECESVYQGKSCSTVDCSGSSNPGHLLHIPIEKSLQALVSSKFMIYLVSILHVHVCIHTSHNILLISPIHITLDHREDLQYPFDASLRDGAIHDIWNGEKLRNSREFFSCPEHLAFSLSTDGVPIFKSSPFSSHRQQASGQSIL